MRLRRAVGWAIAGTSVVLATRVVVYALSPSPLASESRLGGAVGGPRPVLVALVAIGLAVLVSSTLVWIAATGVRERWALADRRPPGPRPRLRLRRMLARALVLWVVCSVAFAMFESYLHWRAGLGFHGLHCLLGPVHQNAVPVLAALSLVAAAAVTAAGHLLAWMRRTVGRLCSPDRSPLGPRGVLALLLPAAAPPGRLLGGLGARGPPLCRG